MSSTAPAAPAAAPAGKKKTLVLVAVAVVALAASGGGAYFFLKSKAPEGGQAAAAAPAPKKPPVFQALDAFTVNLHDAESDHYLQAGITLELADPETQKALADAMPILRGKLILLLSSKRAEELLPKEGKVKLAAEIVEEVKKLLGERGKGVNEVHFSSFVIQ